MQNCYELCFNISKYIYKFFIFISFRTKPKLENNIEYVKMNYYLVDFTKLES